MEFLRELVRFPLYRVLFPLGVGVFAFFLLHGKFLNISPESYLGHTYLLDRASQFPALSTALFIAFLLVIGEVFSFAGELVLNPLFWYVPFTQAGYMERVLPFSSRHLEFSNFDDVLRNNRPVALDMSEVHFSTSRVFCGLMAVMLTYALLDPRTHILALIAVPLSILVLWLCSRESAKWWFGFSVIGLAIVLFVISYFAWFGTSLIDMFIPSGLVVSFFGSVNYRCHANKLIYYNTAKALGDSQ